MSSDAMSVGNRLTEEREARGYGVAELAVLCGVTRDAQRRFEKDENLPGGAYLIAAHAHGVDVKYVMIGERGVAREVLALDVALLRDCIEGVDRGLKAIKRTLAAGPRAALVAECYEWFRARGGATRAKVLEFIQRAA